MASNNNDLFGGLFDFNGDGKTDIGEEFLAYKIFEECTKEDKDTERDVDFDFDDYEGPEDDDLSSDDLDIPLSPLGHSSNTNTQSLQSQPLPKDVPNSEKAIPTEMTLSEYKAVRKRFLGDCIFSLIVGLIMCFLPVLVIWAAFKSYDEKNSASGFVIAVILIVGIVVIGAIIKAISSQISPSWTRLKLSKMAYINTAPKEELNAQKCKRKKAIITVITCIGIVIISLIAFSIVKTTNLSSTYKNAEQLIETENYQDATELLKGIEDSNYKDTAALILLCKSHIEYDKGRYVDAYYTLKEAVFRYQTSSQQSKISSFQSVLDSEYKSYIKRMGERQQQEYESKIVNGVPYVGMSESRIADTSLGKPSDKVRHNYETINGEVYSANLYDFYQNGKRIFTARCIKGRVTEVWDERNNTSSSYTPKSGKSSTGPSVEGFSHPEDFYDWYWDDFYDYEDAEDYYYEHGGR